MTKLKQAATSRKTISNGLWLTLLLSVISAAAANWPALRSAISPEWWFVGTVIIAALTKGLHWWQERQANAELTRGEAVALNAGLEPAKTKGD